MENVNNLKAMCDYFSNQIIILEKESKKQITSLSKLAASTVDSVKFVQDMSLDALERVKKLDERCTSIDETRKFEIDYIKVKILTYPTANQVL